MEIRTPWSLAVALTLSLSAAAVVVPSAASAARPVNGFWAAAASQSHTTVHSSIARSTCRRERVAWSGENTLMRMTVSRRSQAAALRRTVTARTALVRCEAALRAPEPVAPGAPVGGAPAAPSSSGASPANAPTSPTAPETGTPQPGVVVPPTVVPTEASVTVNGAGSGLAVSSTSAITLVGTALGPAPLGTFYTLSVRTGLKGPRPTNCQRGQDSPVFSGALGSLVAPASSGAPWCLGAAQGTLWKGSLGSILGDEGVENVAKVDFTVVAP